MEKENKFKHIINQYRVESNEDLYLRNVKNIKEKWFNDNSHKSQLIGNMLFRNVPDIGYIIQVEDIDIPQEYFKEEYDKIVEAYFSVMDKLDAHYKNKLKSNV